MAIGGSKIIKLLKKNISNIDLYVLSKEFDKTLKDGFISNIYEIPTNEGKTILIKCRTKDGKRNIIIDPKTRINFTNFDYPVPPYPSQFIMALRKYMKGRRIQRIYQHKLDRIIIFELKSSDSDPWKFIIEFFGGGNYILVDGDGLIYMAKRYKKMKDRAVLAKKEYIFPPSRGIDIWEITEKLFVETLSDKEGDIVRNIARAFNIGGYISEEICLRAKIDKNREISSLTEEEFSNLYQTTRNLIDIIKNKEIIPRILLNSDNIPIGFEPFNLEIYSKYPFVIKNNYNEAIDDFFSQFDSEELFSGELKASTKKVNKTEKILIQQLEKVEESKKLRKKSLEHGHLIYRYLTEIESLINTIMTQKRIKKRSWNEISEILEMGKEKNIAECLIFDKIFQKEVKLQIILEGEKFKIDLKKTAIENAQIIYSKAKKAKKKIVGAKKAAKITEEKILLQKEKQQQVETRKAILLKKPKEKWYEKYRWFISSDNFLIVGGRDASSNEAIVKKHMNNNDLFFHADVRGASVCIIKNEMNEKIPETTINETAKFASCYSSAWKLGWGNADIYYVLPEQVSKTPKSGEFLKKGSFVINGKKTFLSKPYLEISIGVRLIPVNLNEDRIISSDLEKEEFEKLQITKEDGEEIQYFPKVFSSPLSSMKNQTSNYVRLKPSKQKSKTSALAKKILEIFIKKSNDKEKRWIRLISVNDIIRLIPSGNGEIVRN
jgi:predicted ribosome quality control (RQC) complex YloA/Tae2 family protein